MNFEKLADDPGPAAAKSRRWCWWGAAIVAVALIGGMVGFRHWRGMRSGDLATAQEKGRQVMAELAAAETAAGLNEDPEQRVRVLESLIAAQRAAIDVRPTEMTARMAEIEKSEVELRSLAGGRDRRASEEREEAAARLMAAGDFAAAATLWREAIELARAAGRSAGEASRGGDRLLRLEQELVRALAEPVDVQRRAAFAAAEAAKAAGRWDEALGRYREARDLQEQLNRDHPRSRFSDLAALGRIDAEIAALTADGLEARVAARWADARRLAESGDAAEAQRAFADAAEAQRKLNERFGRSRFVSMERLEQIEADVQTLKASALRRALEERAAAAGGHLRKRQVFQAQALVQEALEIAERLRAEFPRARGGDDMIGLQLSFLSQRSAELAAMQDAVYDLLAPVAGRSGTAMARTEVSQGLFAQVMSTNPSRTAGRARAVESVTHQEAAEFCRRLTWVMGWRVRLPSEEEMKSAAGEPEIFQDIPAGLDEWLEGTGVEAPVWTGAGTMRASVGARAGDRGFRPVVEVDLAAAL